MKRPALAGILLTTILWLFAVPAGAQSPDSLVLQQPENFEVWSVYRPTRRAFVVWMTWDEPSDSVATFVHQPDTNGWAVTTPSPMLSVPSTIGPYLGDIDRTVFFRAIGSGQVGQVDPLELTFEIRREENLNGRIDVGSGYVPGTYKKILFDDRNTPTIRDDIDYGFQVAFSPGAIDQQGNFIVGLEDYEGFHIWRGIEPDGSDLTVIGEVSKEEAHKGRFTGGSFADSVYFYEVVPTLRENRTWFSQYGTIDCLGTSITLPLQDEEMMWWDCNGFNGFTYYYAVTTFDRGYGVTSGRQGLQKFDNCFHEQGEPYECSDQLQELSLEVNAGSDPKQIYVVPNPYRTGGSRLTTENYHNFPDDVVRFVNVPPNSQIKVYTIAGDLVWETTHDGATGNVIWDTRNRGGELITSGVYIFRVEPQGSEGMYGRFVVIR